MDLLGNMDRLDLMVHQETEVHQDFQDPMGRPECEGLRVLREREENLANLARWVPPVPQVFKVHQDLSVNEESGESPALWDLRVLPASEGERETRDLLVTPVSRVYPDLRDLR